MRAWIAGLSCAAAIAVSALTLTAPLALAAADTIDEARVEAIIERLLTEKPELVIDAIRAYQAREEAAKADEQRKQVLAQKDSILAAASANARCKPCWTWSNATRMCGSSSRNSRSWAKNRFLQRGSR